MGLKNVVSPFIRFLKTSVTLEPVIIVYTFAAFVLDGSKITTNLLIFKICNLTEFTNDTENIDCSNITWIAEQDEVMKDVNNFQVMSSPIFMPKITCVKNNNHHNTHCYLLLIKTVAL